MKLHASIQCRGLCRGKLCDFKPGPKAGWSKEADKSEPNVSGTRRCTFTYSIHTFAYASASLSGRNEQKHVSHAMKFCIAAKSNCRHPTTIQVSDHLNLMFRSRYSVQNAAPDLLHFQDADMLDVARPIVP